MSGVLVAGVGNIFLSDDAFGVELARRLASEPLPDGVRVADFGIRSLHLAYELLDGNYDLTVLLDATARGAAPGTVYLIEPAVCAGGAPEADPHDVRPDAVFAALAALGGRPGKILVVGCEPATTEEGMGLSEPVAAAIEQAARLVRELVAANHGGRDYPRGTVPSVPGSGD